MKELFACFGFEVNNVIAKEMKMKTDFQNFLVKSVVMLIVCCACSAFCAGWKEDFESYPPSQSQYLSPLWENLFTGKVDKSKGMIEKKDIGGNNTQKSTASPWHHIWHSRNIGAKAVGKVEAIAELAIGQDLHPSHPLVNHIILGNAAIGISGSNLSYKVFGKSEIPLFIKQPDVFIKAQAVEPEKWYQVRIVVNQCDKSNDDTADFFFRELGDGDWQTIATGVEMNADFNGNVYISQYATDKYKGYIDNLEVNFESDGSELKTMDLSQNLWQISDLQVSKTMPDLPDTQTPRIPEKWNPVVIGGSWHEQFPDTYPEGKRYEMFWYQNNPIPHYVSGWYKTTFDTPIKDGNENVVLKFDGAAYHALVFVNGKYVGDHKGSFTHFEFKVDDYLNPEGSENTLYVWISNDFGEAPPRHVYGKMFFYNSNMGGIEQPVYLKVVPSYRLNELRIDPNIDDQIVRFKAKTVYNGQDADEMTAVVCVTDIYDNIILPNRPAVIKDGYITGDIAAASLELWNVDNPVVYNLIVEIADSKGKIISKTSQKFGYRQFKAEGTKFYLNGNRVKLYFGNIFSYSSARYDKPQGRRQFIEWLLRQKAQGVNALRYHMAGPNSDTILDICDEVGILVMQEFPMFHRVFSDIPSIDDQRKFLDNALVELSEFMYRDYNHPSVVVWSLSNEVWSNNLALLYQELYRVGSEIETGGRPMCPTSGLNSFGVPNFPVKTDYFDDHNYDMHKVCSPLIADSLARRQQNVRDLYGSISKPWILSEFDAPPKGALRIESTGDIVETYIKYKDDFRVKKIGLDAAVRADVYDKLLLNHSKRIYEFMRSDIVYQGFHPWYTDRNHLPDWHKQLACPYAVLMNPADYNIHWYKSRPVDISVIVMKDYEIDFKGEIAAKIVNSENQTVYSVNKPIEMKSVQDRTDLKISISDCGLDAGCYELVLELADSDSNILNTNKYSIDILEPSRRLLSKSKIGYIGSTEGLNNISRLVETEYFDLVSDIEHLDKFSHIVILPESLAFLPKGFTNNRLLKWLENGGRLLVLEQTSDGYISFLDGFKLDCDSDASNNFVDVLVPEHPIINGLKTSYFRDWVGERNIIVSVGLSPLNDNVVIANGNYSALMAGRIGKGEIVVSLIKASERLGIEPVAEMYLYNLFDYLLNQTVWENTKPLVVPNYPLVAWPDDTVWSTVPLKNHFNKSTTDSREAGTSFLDLGSSDLSHAPVGKHLFCNVPFILGSPESPNIIVMRGHKMPLLPDFVGPIKIDDTAKFLAFLHTAYYSNDKQILIYKVHYKDGSTVDIPIFGKRQIGDWYEPKDVSDAVVAWSKMHPKVAASYGFYIYIWENPYPGKQVESITLQSGMGPVPIVMAISYGK